MTGVQSVDRAIELLEIMADLGGDAGLVELGMRSGLPQSTIHRIMRTFVTRGYAQQSPSRRYTLGPRLIRIGQSAGRQFGVGAEPYLTVLARELGETVNMAVFDRDMAVYVSQASSSHSVRMFTELGARVHCHCTGVGKAILAQLTEATVREVVGRVGMPAATECSISNIGDLLTELVRIRAQGYSVDDGEQEVGVRCFAVPVRGAPAPTAVSVSGPAARVTFEFGERALPVLQQVAEQISHELMPLR